MTEVPDFQVFNPDFVNRVQAKRREKREKSVKPSLEAMVARVFHDPRKLKTVAAPGRETIASIIGRVAKRRGVPVSAILGRSRFRWLVMIRHEAIVEVAVCRPDLSLTQIAREFRRDHSTIFHALSKAGLPRRREIDALEAAE